VTRTLVECSAQAAQKGLWAYHQVSCGCNRSAALALARRPFAHIEAKRTCARRQVCRTSGDGDRLTLSAAACTRHRCVPCCLRLQLLRRRQAVPWHRPNACAQTRCLAEPSAGGMGRVSYAMMRQLCTAAIRSVAVRKSIMCTAGTPMPGSTAPLLPKHAISEPDRFAIAYAVPSSRNALPSTFTCWSSHLTAMSARLLLRTSADGS